MDRNYRFIFEHRQTAHMLQAFPQQTTVLRCDWIGFHVMLAKIADKDSNFAKPNEFNRLNLRSYEKT